MARRKRAVQRTKKKAANRHPKRKTAAKVRPAPRPAEPAPAPTPLTHIDQRGEARMVDVSEKGPPSASRSPKDAC